MRKKLLTALGFAVSILLLYLSLREIDYNQLLTILRNAEYTVLPLAFLFIMISLFLCAYRWSRITGPSINLGDAFSALVIGLFVNNVLPARLGEVARGYVLSKRRQISFTYALSTVFVDRFFDLMGLLLLAVLFYPKKNLPPSVSRGIIVLVVLLVICVVVLILLSREKFAGALSAFLEGTGRPFCVRLAKRLAEIQENLRRIHSPLTFLYLFAISFAIWLSMSLALFLVARMLHVKVDFMVIPFVCALLNVGLTVPSSPGYVGVYQFLIIYLLAIFGVPKAEGFAVSVLYHALWYFPYNIMGFIFSIREHLKVTELTRLEEKT